MSDTFNGSVQAAVKHLGIESWMMVLDFDQIVGFVDIWSAGRLAVCRDRFEMVGRR